MITRPDREQKQWRPKLHTMYLPDDVGTSYDVDWIDERSSHHEAQTSPAAQVESKCQ